MAGKELTPEWFRRINGHRSARWIEQNKRIDAGDLAAWVFDRYGCIRLFSEYELDEIRKPAVLE